MTVLSLKNKTSRYFVLFYVSLPQIIINNLISMKNKKCKKKSNFHLPVLTDLWLAVNCMEIQDFVQLPSISLLWYTWNDNENVLEKCENVLEKVLEKCLNFFLETCTHHGNSFTHSLWANQILWKCCSHMKPNAQLSWHVQNFGLSSLE